MSSPLSFAKVPCLHRAIKSKAKMKYLEELETGKTATPQHGKKANSLNSDVTTIVSWGHWGKFLNLPKESDDPTSMSPVVYSILGVQKHLKAFYYSVLKFMMLLRSKNHRVPVMQGRYI